MWIYKRSLTEYYIKVELYGAHFYIHITIENISNNKFNCRKKRITFIVSVKTNGWIIELFNIFRHVTITIINDTI